MSQYDLIPEEIYDDLPEDEHSKFAYLVGVAQANLARMLDQHGSNDFADEIRDQFVSIVTGIADALGIEGLPPVDNDTSSYRAYTAFQVRLSGIVAKVRLQPNLLAKPHSVALGRITRAKLKQEVDHLRRLVDESELPQAKRESLLAKLDQFEKELGKQRLSFAQAMAIAASVMAVVGGATTALAQGPEAAETILKIIRLMGEDKEKEETERLRLAPPPKALPNYSPLAPTTFASNDFDDEVPF